MNGNLDQQFSISRIYHACRIGESALSAGRARQLLLLILANRTLTLQGLGTALVTVLKPLLTVVINVKLLFEH